MKALTLSFLLLQFNLFAEEPTLPMGLFGGETTTLKDQEEPLETSSFEHTGFLDLRAGSRFQSDPNQRQLSLAEIRVQNNLFYEKDRFKFKASLDLLGDLAEKNSENTDLRKGNGLVDLRELHFSYRPNNYVDLKAGRQILTWGTGDLIFINDLFPKDWQAFFSGRDLNYLKAPSDAVKGSLYFGGYTLDLVYTPVFDSDRYIDGSRNSFYSPAFQQMVGYKTGFSTQEEESGEIALRLKKNIGSTELALYGYKGFWKSPMGLNSQGEFTFPELQVLGASARFPLLGGIANAEIGYYDSKEDSLGTNPSVPNDEFRWLVGFEREVAKNTTASFQYYGEEMQDYDAYRTFRGATKSQSRHMITAKIRQTYWQQLASASAMVFYSHTDQDAHYRLNADYKVTDDTKVFVGVNGFFGKERTTFWGQFEDNSSIYTGVTFNF